MSLSSGMVAVLAPATTAPLPSPDPFDSKDTDSTAGNTSGMNGHTSSGAAADSHGTDNGNADDMDNGNADDMDNDIDNDNEDDKVNGEDEDFVTLVSSDGVEFKLPRSCATQSGTIGMLLSTELDFEESHTRVICFPDISTAILKKVCEYLQYRYEFDGMEKVPEFPIDPEIALDLMLAADFLDA